MAPVGVGEGRMTTGIWCSRKEDTRVGGSNGHERALKEEIGWDGPSSPSTVWIGTEVSTLPVALSQLPPYLSTTKVLKQTPVCRAPIGSASSRRHARFTTLSLTASPATNRPRLCACL